MREYLIGGIGVVMAALFFAIPAATADAHSPHGWHHGYGGRAYPRYVYPARSAYPIGPIVPRVYAPFVSPVPAYAPALVVPRSAYYPYWHHRR